MGTNVLMAKNIKREWHHFDANGKILGRLATEVATILMGKKKPSFVPYLDTGDYVVVTNVSKVKLTGNKMQDKTYTSHSGYPGGLKVETFEKLIIRKPVFVFEHAVAGMLPGTKLGKQMIKKLKAFPGSEHPFGKHIKKEDKEQI